MLDATIYHCPRLEKAKSLRNSASLRELTCQLSSDTYSTLGQYNIAFLGPEMEKANLCRYRKYCFNTEKKFISS